MAEMTAGELRKQLAEEGIAWTVNPLLADDAQAPRYATGGEAGCVPLAATVPHVDVAALVAASPPTNTLLRAYLVTRGVIAASQGELSRGSSSWPPSIESPSKPDLLSGTGEQSSPLFGGPPSSAGV